jgi:hypothetical protein
LRQRLREYEHMFYQLRLNENLVDQQLRA